MPFLIKFHEQYGFYSIRWSGVVMYTDLREFFKAIAERDWFRPGLNALHDFREAQIALSDLELADLTGFYSNLADMFGPGRSVNIVTDQAGQGLAGALRAARLQVGREHISVAALPSALEALGLPEEAELEL